MAIIKNEFPILEYDTSSEEILKPDHCFRDLKLPEKCVFPFLGGVVDKFAAENGAVTADYLLTITRKYPIYVVRYRGEEMTLCQAPLGASAAAQSLDSLISCGVRKIVCAGSCGAITRLPENAFMVPVRAIRDEGTSYKYLPPSRFIDLDPEMTSLIERVLTEKGVPFAECMTWTTDGFFRETKDMVAYRREEGCSVVEMECAALAACAEKRGAAFGQILFTADSLADAERHDSRNWGTASFRPALALLFDIAAELNCRDNSDC